MGQDKIFHRANETRGGLFRAALPTQAQRLLSITQGETAHIAAQTFIADRNKRCRRAGAHLKGTRKIVLRKGQDG